METLIVLDRCQACAVIGGAGTKEGRLARTLGRLVGAALRALIDMLTNPKTPQAETEG